MPNDWQHVKLGSLGEFRNGASFGRDQFGPGLPVINVKHLYSGRFFEIDDLEEIKTTAIRNASVLAVQRGDILFAHSSVKRSGAGQAAMVDTFRPSTVFSGFVVRFRLARLDLALPEFLNYVLRSPIYREILPRIASGTTITNLSQDVLSGLEVPLPSLREQRAITEVVGSLDDKIEQNRRTGSKLEGLARGVFRAWFVDFEPVKAKAAGATAFPGMPSETFAALPDRFTDSPLGPVPEGWEVGTLSDVADVIMGTSPPSDTYNDAANGHALINGPVEYGERFPLRVKWTTAPVKLAESGDLIFCVRGSTTGRRVFSDGVYGLGRGVCAIRSKHRVQPFVNQLIDSELRRLLAGTTGSVFPSLSAPAIKGFEIVRPVSDVIRAFSDFAESMLQATNTGADESTKLAAPRSNSR